MFTLFSSRHGAVRAPVPTAQGRSRRRARWTILGLASSVAAAVLTGASPAQAQLPCQPWPVCTTEPSIAYVNLALNAIVVPTSLMPAPLCTLGSGPDNVVDGKWSNIYTDKWCVRSGGARLQIQLRNPSSLGTLVGGKWTRSLSSTPE
jgi:hypothetical protein